MIKIEIKSKISGWIGLSQDGSGSSRTPTPVGLFDIFPNPNPHTPTPTPDLAVVGPRPRTWSTIKFLPPRFARSVGLDLNYSIF